MKGLKNFLKRSLSCALTLALAIPSIPVYATSETNVNFNVSATTIDITVPLNFACAIDPNEDNGFTYASNLTITNNTKAPIELSISDFSDTSSTFENDILPSELPSGKTWNKLNVSDTKKYFSLGINASNSNEWLEYYPTENVYAKEVQEAAVTLGAIDPGVSVNFDLDASYGRAVKDSFTFSYKVTWMATLYEGTSLYMVDEASTTSLEYELNASSPNYLDALPNYLDNPDGEEIDSSKIVGTCKIIGLKADADITDIVVCDYYEDESGNLYKILGIKEGSSDNYTISDNNIYTLTIGESIINLGDYGIGNCSNLTQVVINGDNTNLENNFENCDNIINIVTPNETVKNKIVSLLIIDDSKVTIDGEKNGTCSIHCFNTTKHEATQTEYGYTKKECPFCGLVLYTIEFYEYPTAGLYDASGNLLCTWEESGIKNNGSVLSEVSKIINNTYPTTTKVVVKEGVTSIAEHEFNNCTTLKEVILPDTITLIDSYAFQSCTSLERIYLPSGANISTCAFYLCSNLKEVYIPEGATYIDGSAFASCYKLQSITIPASIQSIGTSAFSDCYFTDSTLINNSSVDNSNLGATICDSIENGFAIKDGVLERYVGDESVIEIPSTVTSLGRYAFHGNTTITSVVIPSSVTSIGDQSFYNCYNLRHIEIPSSVTSYGSEPFSGTYLIQSEVINKSTQTLTYKGMMYIERVDGDFLYKNTDQLVRYVGTDRNVVIPEGTTKLLYKSFVDANINSIVIPTSLTSMADNAFYNSSITTINYKGTEEEWSAITLGTNTSVTNATINYNYTE